MERHVLCAGMGRFGIHLLSDAFALQEQLLLEEDAKFSSNAQVEKYSSRIRWNVSVPKLLSGMETIAFRTHAQMEDNTVLSIYHVCAQTIKSGTITDAFPPRYPVQRVWSGIMLFMLVNVQLELFQTIINAILFQYVEMAWHIILSLISAHALLEKFSEISSVWIPIARMANIGMEINVKLFRAHLHHTSIKTDVFMEDLINAPMGTFGMDKLVFSTLLLVL